MLIRVLNSKGDEPYEFSDMKAAKDMFELLLESPIGRTAFKVTPSKSGSSEVDSEMIREFDPTAQEIWFVGQLAGG
jgi:hypothetical protein